MENKTQDEELITRVEDQQEEEGTGFIYPVQVPSEGGEVLAEKEKEEERMEQELHKFLNSIGEETLQLKEFLSEENRLMNELCISIRKILKKLNIAFNIPPQKVPLRREAKRVILNEEANLMIVSPTGEVRSAFLAKYPPEVIMAVLCTVMPRLTEYVVVYKKKIGRRVGFLRKLKMELKNIAKTIGGEERETTGQRAREVTDHKM